MKLRSISLIVVVFLLLASSLSACGGSASDPLTLAPKDILPDEVKTASTSVQEAYRFAAANPDVLAQYPCYCGCGNMGHQSNRDCFIKNINPDGTIEFDNHANGCTLCVDIAQDVMRLMREGKDAVTIRDYIDTTYSPFGPGTDTPPVGSVNSTSSVSSTGAANDGSAIEACTKEVPTCGEDTGGSAPALNLDGAPQSAAPAPGK